MYLRQVSIKQWQPILGSVYTLYHTIIWPNNHREKNMLRFNPVQVAEWVSDLYEAQTATAGNRVVTTATELGISRTRIIHFLNLMRIPADLRARLKVMADLTESKLRPIVQTSPGGIRSVFERVIGLEILSRAG